ncbi:AMP-binding protein [Rhodococcus sp. H29-C3]|uniref:class I adenylate-forming enzyme family protein n=1 Tax=Rhodococcus sp. H29-C3 TaxID=3046307 RepID=UPI0024BA2F72|nr:AMP-binding protein [Rhodococcus sp. H29-C3]MDJ0360824.1 AMP-binding protein [Rhodococcus sp. H29-C3]
MNTTLISTPPTSEPLHVIPSDLLDLTAIESPTSVALHAPDGRTVDYRTLAELVATTSTALVAASVGRGDRVVTRLTNDVPAVAMVFAAWSVGAVAVPLPPSMTDIQLASVADDCTPALVVVEQLPENTAAFASPVLTWVGLGTAKPPEPTLRRPVHDDEPALLMYTSGSTSKPKGVICPAAAIVFAVGSIGRQLEYRASDTVLLMSPLSFDYGLYQVLLSFASGASVVLADASNALGLLRTIRSRPVTVVPAVPAVAGMLHTLLSRGGSVDTVRMVTNTGADLPPSRIAELRIIFPHAAIIAMYGITECKRVTIAEPDLDLHRPGSVGRAIPGTRITVLDDSGRPVEPGTDGQIVAIGPHVMAGYWGAGELTAERFGVDALSGERMLLTGDYGRIDADGYLYFTGRRDDIFKAAGVRTSVSEISAAVESLDIVQSVIVLKPTDDHGLSIVVTATASGSEILSALATILEPAKIPTRCVVLDELPLTPNGKVDTRRAELALTKDTP